MFRYGNIVSPRDHQHIADLVTEAKYSSVQSKLSEPQSLMDLFNEVANVEENKENATPKQTLPIPKVC
jgi:hypothetical protein